jgi:hypothetical protein
MTQHQDDLLVQILSQCCDLLGAGESVAACLERFPDHAAALEPLLTAVAGVQRFRPVPPRAEVTVVARRSEFMTAAHEAARVARNRPTGALAAIALWWRNAFSGFDQFFRPTGNSRVVPVGLVATLMAVILLGTLATGAITASANAIPGDPLYPVKTVAERARVMLARDPQTRIKLEEQIASQHLQDIGEVLRLQRRVDRMPFAGIIEDITPSEWEVSGLRISITPETVIHGTPWLGASVTGTVRAPGDGTLVALLLTVQPMPPTAFASVPSSTPTTPPTATPVPPTPRPTRTPPPPTATSEPTATDPQPTPSPTKVRESATPTARPTATRTRTRVPTATLTPTTRPTATWTPWSTPPRSDVKKHIIGWVKRIEHGRWTIGDITVDTDADTVFIGDPGVGSQVEAELLVRQDGSYLALLIKELGGPTTTPEPYDLTGVVGSIGGSQWTIDGTVVKIDGDTQIDEGIQVGDWVNVGGERRSGGEIWAKTIHKLVPQTYQFQGYIESINGDTWTVAGHTFKVTGDTEIIGDPEVGRMAQVEVLELPDGRLEAKLIYIVPDTPTPTDTPVPPTPTDTPAPATPTDTPAPPTPTDTPAPATPTDTPAPPTVTDTPAPQPSSTNTPVPQPSPTDTQAPEPPPTDTPAPPSPVAPDTATPEPPPPSPAPQDTPTPQAV